MSTGTSGTGGSERLAIELDHAMLAPDRSSGIQAQSVSLHFVLVATDYVSHLSLQAPNLAVLIGAPQSTSPDMCVHGLSGSDNVQRSSLLLHCTT